MRATTVKPRNGRHGERQPSKHGNMNLPQDASFFLYPALFQCKSVCLVVHVHCWGKFPLKISDYSNCTLLLFSITNISLDFKIQQYRHLLFKIPLLHFSFSCSSFSSLFYTFFGSSFLLTSPVVPFIYLRSPCLSISILKK